MTASDPEFADETGGIQEDLRSRTASQLLKRLDQIAADTIGVFRFSGTDSLDADYCRRVSHHLVHLMAFAVRDGHVDPRGGFLGDLHRILLERRLPTERLFTLVYLTERTALDELALDDRLGATSEPWPLVAQLVRRASFDLLGAYIERTQLEPGCAAITDKLTTLYTRPLFDAVLAKEVLRAGRFGYPTSLILFDVDRLSAINQEHGYGVGDKILEQLGILIRKYFRQHDWVARHSDDSVAVLLPRTDAANASELAERVRYTVEKRLQFVDHKTDRPVPVTLTAAVVNLNIEIGDMVDAERFLAEAETGVMHAKQQGRNRVVRIDRLSGPAV